MPQKKQQTHKVKLLLAIINREDEATYTDAVNEVCTALNFSGIAHGTASSNYLNYFGLGEIQKKIVFSLIPDFAEQNVLSAVGHALKLYLVGKGIAFTISLSGISDVIAGVVLSSAERGDNAEHRNRKRVSKKEKSDMHELVVAVVNQKYTDEAIEAAKRAGATGATVLNTMSINNAPAEQKLGTAVSIETDTLMFLTSAEYKIRIMEALRDSAGLKTDGKAVIFSLHVDDLVGIGRFDDPADHI